MWEIMHSAIDGPGNVLENASPRHYRPAEGLAVTGTTNFDSDDVGRIGDLFGVSVSAV